MVLSEDELYLNEYREFGLSLYDTHGDGSGVVHSGSRRPMLNVRPGLYTFIYVNDTHILKWLETKGFDYDVATDENLHRHRQDLLQPYRVLITVSHPEYYSTRCGTRSMTFNVPAAGTCNWEETDSTGASRSRIRIPASSKPAGVFRVSEHGKANPANTRGTLPANPAASGVRMATRPKDLSGPDSVQRCWYDLAGSGVNMTACGHTSSFSRGWNPT
ncbi:MAG: hypothetical protein OXL68_08675 [Paracoccaceae bacterium]|nr:hypothetical protein [Paracoccaceae bacterium]